MCRMLIDRGADINAANRRGNTALHFAYAYEFPKVVKMLADAGANVHAVNCDGLTCEQGIMDDIAKGRQDEFCRKGNG